MVAFILITGGALLGAAGLRRLAFAPGEGASLLVGAGITLIGALAA